MNQHAMYGLVPPSLSDAPEGAVQCSPLMPGAWALDDVVPSTLASITILAPAGTIERRYKMALALRALRAGAPFTILAPKDKGGSRLAAELKAFGCEVTDDSKQHHRICRGVRPAELKDIDAAIAEGAPRFSEILAMWTQPGVFSWDRVDAGSALLASRLPPLQGRGADLGCGIGFLSRAILASPEVTQLAMLDIDRRAVAMATKNMDDPRTDIHWADATKAPLSGFDFIVTNPPFHDGGIEDRALGEAFIAAAARGLRTGGACWLVANRHLPYEAVMKPLFARIHLHAEQDGFKVYEAIK